MIAGNPPEPQHRCSQHRQPSLREILLSRQPGRSHQSHLGGSYAHRSARNIRAPQKPDRSSSFKARKHSIPPLDKHPGKALALLATPVFSGRSLADLIGNAFMKSHL